MPYWTERKIDFAAKLLMPVAVVIAGGLIQQGISKQSTATQYVEIAARILADKGQDQELRAWAVRVLDRYSSVPFSEPLRLELEQGRSILSGFFGSQPAVGRGDLSIEELQVLDDHARQKLEAELERAREHERAKNSTN